MEPQKNSEGWKRAAVAGLLSLPLYVGITLLSKQFNWGEGYAGRPIPAYLALYTGLFCLQAWAVWLIVRKRLRGRATLWAVIVLGLAFRAVLLPAQQIQEDDVYRYLWDGKVFAQGINPFEYAPEEVTQFKFMEIRQPEEFRRKYDDRNRRDLERLHQLKWENPASLVFMERVNHPEVPTIYPPLAQYVFRAVAEVRPDSILALRLAFLLFDLTAVAFIILTLKAVGGNPNLCAVYFWSPLIVKETFNSTHLDIIGISMLCASLYYLVRQRYLPATVFLAFSVLGKIYPVILLPIYLREMAFGRGPGGEPAWDWKRPALNLLIFTAVVGILYLPFLDIGMRAFEGLRTYATYWQKNDSIFALLVYFFGEVLGFESGGEVPLSYDLPSLLAKLTVALILLGTVMYLVFRPAPGRGAGAGEGILKEAFIIMALVFLLSPVQNPWYLCWVVPFLCFYPRRAWILLTGLVGMYYLDFYFDYQEWQEYRRWIPWFEYTPFYLLLAWDGWKRKTVSGG